jgi:hypothetical protein
MEPEVNKNTQIKLLSFGLAFILLIVLKILI